MFDDAPDLRIAALGDVSLAYVMRGRGAPLVFVHGGLDDYRYWLPHLDAFASRHRVLAYSRRYNHPNPPSPPLEDYSAQTDAEDLDRLLQQLDLGPVTLVGASYGAYASLLFALRRPGLVRSLVLCEAPVLRWLPELPGGEEALDALQRNIWAPVGQAFRAGDVDRAVRMAIDGLVGPGFIDSLPSEYLAYVRSNAREWEVLTASRDAFPPVAKDAVRSLGMSVLLMGGERTMVHHKLVDAELGRLLPRCTRVVIPGASHDLWTDAPEACRKATREFLDRA